LKTKKPVGSSFFYWKAAFFIITPILLIVLSSMIFNYAYPYNHAIAKYISLSGNNEIASISKPKFVEIGGASALPGADRVSLADGVNLKTSISLKVTKPGLDTQIKAFIPEIMHHVNMLLESKKSSDLASPEGKEMLAEEIKRQIEYVIGFRKLVPVMGLMQADNEPSTRNSGIAEVLFTTFIMQY
jgi:flagellar basal body-associated protein FliL